MKTNKRNLCKLLFFAVCIASASIFFSVRNTSADDLALVLTLKNVEALAGGEGSSVWCFGSGTIECNGAKVKTVYYAR